ncbi:polynucleotide adenylyltransferase region [Richelia sinica FACHB-800]|uniref:Polynucleotide adenylyltransferase region n=1 Tax=Richelia sinica FACHB-800 TaxID=1357546 RepID=A0A975TBE8_9NOST|nr:CCA tRNA nucleotidyltransferase [Richelia sinica]MBD2664024.1 CCA tRNA nucleotidyltransferase [Richelia sinica FACHB-800]QXE24923.1 polynucleotide adenylyltransferase region [Richelia sinica FACHB-800]
MPDSFLARLAAENWPFSLECLPPNSYMVGGAVRDALLGRSREYWDLDFVIPGEAVKVAKTVAQRYQAGFVLLDAERQIARVVFPNATVDFAQQEGESLTTDLHRRDFTINAIAYHPHTQAIIDPLQGCADITAGILRMISPANLQDDPLRLMRAYRQAAQLGFTIEAATQATIRSLATTINTVAAERVRVEIGYLLANSQGTPWLTQAWEDGLLTNWFPNACIQSFAQLAAIDKAADVLGENWPQLGEKFREYIRDTIKTTWLGIAKLACLVNSSPELAEQELLELSYSRAETRAVSAALKLFPQLTIQDMPLREQYFFFQAAGDVFTAIAVLALAHDTPLEAIAPFIQRYLNPNDLVAHPSPLVSGREIMIALKIPASPEVGRLLTEIAVAQAEGKIATVAQAINFAQKLVEIEN